MVCESVRSHLIDTLFPEYLVVDQDRSSDLFGSARTDIYLDFDFDDC